MPESLWERVEPLLPPSIGLAPVRPNWLYGDRGYDYDHHRKALRERGISHASPAATPTTDPDSAPSDG